MSLWQRREGALGILTPGKVLGAALSTPLPAGGGHCEIIYSGRCWCAQRSSLSEREVRKELEGGSSPRHPRGWSSCKGLPYPESPGWQGYLYIDKKLKTQDWSNLSIYLPLMEIVLRPSCFLQGNLVNPAQVRMCSWNRGLAAHPCEHTMKCS